MDDVEAGEVAEPWLVEPDHRRQVARFVGEADDRVVR
jgi:hypothetical protein